MVTMAVKRKKPRSKREINEGIQNILEARRRFDYDYIPYGKNWTMPDGNYHYRRRFPDSLIVGFWRTVMKLFAPLLLFLVYGYRVTGRKNLRELKGKGALCICNHISFLDTLFVREAVGHYRSYHTMSYFNNKKGFGGHVVRHGGMLPISNNFAAMRNLNAEMKRLLEKGKIVNFYPERAMWLNYPKPRPMMDGVFSYAVKFDVPVLPIFVTFKKNKRGKMKKMRINILPPVYGEEGAGRKEKIAAFRRDCEKSWQDCYEEAYGEKLEYLNKE